MPGRHANTGNYRYGYNGMEIDNELKGEGNSYDFGARIYDPRIGRWLSTDIFFKEYPGHSPFSFAMNVPTNAIDPDGNLVIFIGGLRLWYGARDQPRYGELGPFEGGLNGIYDNDVYDYWSTDENSFGNSVNFAYSMMQRIGDFKSLFTSGSAEWTSQAGRRHMDGVNRAIEFHNKVLAGEIILAAGETIKIVSHSQGGAHAAGFANQLLSYTDDEGNPLYNIEVIYYITPHQPKDIDHPKSVRGVQYSHPDDAVASDEPWWMPNGGTEFGKIPNVQEFVESQELKSTGNIGEIKMKRFEDYKRGDSPFEFVSGNRGQHNVNDNMQVLDRPKGSPGYIAPRKDTNVKDVRVGPLKEDGSY